MLKKLCDHHESILLYGANEDTDKDDAKKVEENDLAERSVSSRSRVVTPALVVHHHRI